MEDLFLRNSGIEVAVEPTWPSPRRYGYRSKITPHFQRLRKDRPVVIGFQMRGSRKLIDVPQCPIATEAINRALPTERERIVSESGKSRRGGTLLLRDTLEGVVTDNNAVVSQKVGDFVFQFQAGEFFQNNPYIHPDLVNHVVDQAADPTIGTVVDTYCGVGVFSISCSPGIDQAIGVEISPISIHWANANAKINRVENCKFSIGEAEAIFRKLDCDPETTCVIIDPPRKGCESSFLDQLVEFAPRRIVYVSCDPATQARDVGILAEKGYRAVLIQPFDLFPQTRHIECVATLEREES